MNFPNKLSEFSIRMEVVRPVAVPEIKQGELANFAFSKWRDSFVAEVNAYYSHSPTSAGPTSSTSRLPSG